MAKKKTTETAAPDERFSHFEAVTTKEVLYENGIVVRVKPFLTSAEFLTAYEEMCSYVLTPSGYHPEYAAFAFRLITLRYFTDFKVPDTLEEAFKVCFNDALYNPIREALWNNAQLVAISGAVDQRQKSFEYGTVLNMRDASFDEKALEALDSISGSMWTIREACNSLYDRISGLLDTLNYSDEDKQQVVEFVARANKLTDKAFVKEVVATQLEK